MPDHFHLLIQPWRADLKGKVCANPSRLLQQLKRRTAYRVLEILRANSGQTECRKTLARFRLPETVHDQAQYRVWQRRYYVMNVFTEKKRLEKLHYMHGNRKGRRLEKAVGLGKDYGLTALSRRV